MEVWGFGLEVIAISASGVLAPGPLFFANLLYGTRQGTSAGLKMAYGHTAVELPLIIVLGAGLFSSSLADQYGDVIGIIGGIAILVFAGLQIVRLIRRNKQSPPVGASSKSPLLAGIVLSALNPFFLVWWFTVGLKLVADSQSFGLALGIGLLFGFHIWMDYAWLAGTAYLASKGSSVLKSRYYTVLILALVVALAYYGIYFLLQSLAT